MLEDRVVPTITEHVTAGGVLQINPVGSIFPNQGFTRMDVLATSVPGLKYGLMERVSGVSVYPWGSGAPNPFEPAASPAFNQDRIFRGEGFQYINLGQGVGSSESIPIRFSDGFTNQDDTLVIIIDPAPAPTIYTQPAGQTNLRVGQSAALSVVAVGSSLSYQWYSGASGDTAHPISGANSSQYTTPAFTSAQQDAFWVRVSNSSGSADSTTANVTVTGAVTTTTTASNATVTFSPGAQKVTLQATVTGDNGPLNVGSVTFTVPGIGTVTSSTVTGNLATATLTIPAGATAGAYQIQAQYQGPGGVSPSSDNGKTLTIAKATPHVTWANPAAIVYGTPLSATQLDATADVSGSFAYTPPAGTVLNAGLNQVLSTTFTPGDTTDYSTVSQSVSISVGQAPLTITADDATRLYGAVNPAFTVHYAGFVNGDGPAQLLSLPSVTTTATPGSHVGAYPLTAGGAAAANYSIRYVGGTLTVTPAPLTITADDKSRPYALGNPPLTASYKGFVNHDTPLSLTALPTLGTTANPASPPGTYPITVGGAVDQDYAITYVTGTLTVQGLPAVQSVQVNDGTAQRSMVTSVTITFASPVYGVPPGSIVIYAGGTALVPTSFVVSGTNQVKVLFAGLPGVVHGSLPDGVYSLAVSGKAVAVDHFFRLFGDANGDGRVDQTDLAAFMLAYRTRSTSANYRSYFDVNGDGSVDLTDYYQFLARYNTHLTP
ncbi:MAG TPA: MBG domain-containing protein [Gemmataceae bacterium]|nr:MBG domain-containing protein [Gemmataceae bacterium]